MRTLFKIIILCAGVILWVGCNQSGSTMAVHSGGTPTSETELERDLSNQFKAYWYNGTAEITSYQLRQERYGEMREGTAVNVYVTEDFLPDVQVKADRSSAKNIPVLKLNSTKKYLTGIYPYSVMTSTFSPVTSNEHAIKVAHSMQEWCGQVYVQLNNRKHYEITSHSYFQGEADRSFTLPKTYLESELWNRVRIDPTTLPTNEFNILPSFEYFRMSHSEVEAKKAMGHLVQGDSISVYTLSYVDLPRKLSIYFESEFPHEIERWEETHKNGLITTAEKMKRIKTDYWNKNGNTHQFLRDSLGL
ncbi:MAG: septum formation inhibitor Maf [Bacteroidota bacterium]